MTSIKAPVKGYKVFKPDFTCRGFQFAENTEYRHEGEIHICNQGFHFCIKPAHCFSYYDFTPENIVCEVEGLGNIQTHEGDSKVCTDYIRIGRRLTWQEVLELCNDGKDNTGFSNTGSRNTGNCNTGSRNTGNCNTGNRNTGHCNTGNCNTGNRNTGNRNTGDWNTGDCNTGYWNTGDWNTGHSNTGHCNTGSRNTGNRNTGDRNTGDRNTGDCNTGHWNTGNRNTGAFCTNDAPFPMFNKPSDWTEQDFVNSRAYHLMRNDVHTKIWVPDHAMSDQEKADNRGWKNAGGYYKDIPFKEAFKNAWHNWSKEDRKAFTTLPNFDADVFEEITGVKILSEG
jgi:hypothetical protein